MSKEARVDLRISKEHKEILEQAAAIMGQPLTTFILSSTLDRARDILDREVVTKLSRRDMNRLFKILENPKKPGPALRKAAKRYKALYMTSKESEAQPD
jgi:uncharacterized protein (DUF1778 family)